ncbi:hypothetical protein Tco_0294214 [Tanacetum coccineum]
MANLTDMLAKFVTAITLLLQGQGHYCSDYLNTPLVQREQCTLPVLKVPHSSNLRENYEVALELPLNPGLARTFDGTDIVRTVILNKLPRKLGDPGKFLIPYFEPGTPVPLILGEVLLNVQGRALIDVHNKGELKTLCIGSEAITYNLDSDFEDTQATISLTCGKQDWGPAVIDTGL